MDKEKLDAIIARVEVWKSNSASNASAGGTVALYHEGMNDAYSDVLDLLKV